MGSIKGNNMTKLPFKKGDKIQATLQLPSNRAVIIVGKIRQVRTIFGRQEYQVDWGRSEPFWITEKYLSLDKGKI